MAHPIYNGKCQMDGCNNARAYYIRKFPPERVGEVSKYKYCPSCKNIWDNYKITLQDKKDLYAQQNGCCAICDKNISFSGRGGGAIDHCHATGVVRGMLCKECNTGLGKLGDTTEALERALDYLKGVDYA